MDKRLTWAEHRVFNRSARLFDALGSQALSRLVPLGSDIALVVSEQGQVEDVAYRDAELGDYGIDNWVGRPWQDTVTIESVEKVDALVAEAGEIGVTRRRQVNHPANGQPDLPVDYMVVTVSQDAPRIVLGSDLRKFANLQQRLVETQTELESEYRKIREAEGRYRSVFHLSNRAMVIVDPKARRTLDVNAAAARLLAKPPRKIVGESVLNLFSRSQHNIITDVFSEAHHRGTPQSVKVPLGNSKSEFTIDVEPYREHGQNNLLLMFEPAHDAAQSASPRDEAKTLIDSLPESIVATDAKGAIIDVNDQFLDLVQVLHRDRVVGRNLNNWLGASSVDLQVLLSRVREESRVQRFATIVRDELGGSHDVAVTAALHASNGSEERIGLLLVRVAPREASASLTSGSMVPDPSDFSELVGRVPLKELIREAVDVIERLSIEAALRQTGNNRASAADMLGLSRQSLYIKLKRYGLEDFGNDD